MRTILWALFCSCSVFPLVLRRLITRVHKELHDIIGRIGKKHRYPMKLVHVIRRIDSVIRTERAEHFCRELEIDYIDDLVAVKTKLSTGYAHNESIPLLVIRMAEHSRDKIFFEGIVRRGAVGREAAGKKLLFCHCKSLQSFHAAALALIRSIMRLIPSQRERSVNISTMLPLSVNGASCKTDISFIIPF